MRAKDTYNSPEGSQKFLDFLASEDGQIFRHTLLEAFRPHLGSNYNQAILDAACGAGWLTEQLSAEFPNIQGCDGSTFFLDHARNNSPQLTFTEADLAGPLPYQDNQFDTIIFSMAAHDVEDQPKTFAELHRILKPGGQLLMAITNPYYAFPVGTWRRHWWQKLFSFKPQLRVSPYHWFSTHHRNYTFHQKLQSYFYKLSEHLNNAIGAGFILKKFEELGSDQDSPHYNMQYRLHRFPILLLMKFEKAGQ